ncbi:VOC family protein [Geodermatophilus sp. DSM 44513]|uniref:VOC family protein n=1 Tax=Geodermatophilus sp. DSM 44513 TaxID=1528104 RepID=UPI00127D1803|nr:VOC family protein [Geodermatophilus sp. DSM 44513]WNV75716.1 VOC family protein [Geodermatophilus sp. DSM 44513]
MTTLLSAYLGYRDARAALDWLTALGFTEVRRQEGPDGVVTHAEVRWGDAVVVVDGGEDVDPPAPPLVGQSTGRGLYLRVDDVDGAFERAVAAGGRSVVEPENTIWHTRRARVLDPGGQEWTLGTYEPGVAW